MIIWRRLSYKRPKNKPRLVAGAGGLVSVCGAFALFFNCNIFCVHLCCLHNESIINIFRKFSEKQIVVSALLSVAKYEHER